MGDNEERAREFVDFIKTGEIQEFDSVKGLISYLQKNYNLGKVLIQRAISIAVKKGWLEKKEREFFGGPMGIKIGSGIPPTPKPSKNSLKKAKRKGKKKVVVAELPEFSFAKIAELLVQKVEEMLVEQDARIAKQKREISELKEAIASIQFDQSRVNQMEEKITRIETEIGSGTEKLLQVLHTLKGKN